MFTKKLIDVQFDLANGQFEGGGNTKTVSGLRVSCHIVNVGGGNGQAEISIYGLPLSLMNQLSTVGTQYLKMYKNGISIRAGSVEEGMSVVWTGAIGTAFVDAQSMPEVAFRVLSTPGAFQAINPVKPLSVKGTADVSGLLGNLAKQMGFQYEDAGVTAKLANPYYAGTAWTQMVELARDAGVDIVIDRGTVVAVPPAKTRSGDAFQIIGGQNMRGYPMFQQAYVVVTALFDPALKPYGEIEIKSALTPANGKWKANRLEYDLESQVPHGNWFMTVEGVQIGATTP